MYLTLDEAAANLGKTPRQIRYMIQMGDLTADKVGGRWRIDSKALPATGAQKEARARKGRALRRAVEEALEVSRESKRRYSVNDLYLSRTCLAGGETPAMRASASSGGKG